MPGSACAPLSAEWTRESTSWAEASQTLPPETQTGLEQEAWIGTPGSCLAAALGHAWAKEIHMELCSWKETQLTKAGNGDWSPSLWG